MLKGTGRKMKSICPLCRATAEGVSPTGDWRRYDCPACGSFEISGTEETRARADEAVAQEHRERIARERTRGIKLHRVGIIAQRDRDK